MTTSQNGRKLIEAFEGFAPAAYQDQRGIWTCGYGHTLGVTPTTTCNQSQADAWMSEDLATAEAAVNALEVELNQNQFDACVSLCYNIGAGNFAASTVAADLKAGLPKAASFAFLMWVKTNGKENPGLVRRRNAEKALFLTPIDV